MKRLVLMPLLALLFLAACSKSAKLNNKLDGSWTLKTVNGTPAFNGTPIDANYTKVFTLTKYGKNNGTYSIETSVYSVPAFSETGTYTLIEDTKIITKQTNSSITDTSFVVYYDKTTLKIMKDSNTFEYAKN